MQPDRNITFGQKIRIVRLTGLLIPFQNATSNQVTATEVGQVRSEQAGFGRITNFRRVLHLVAGGNANDTMAACTLLFEDRLTLSGLRTVSGGSSGLFGSNGPGIKIIR